MSNLAGRPESVESTNPNETYEVMLLAKLLLRKYGVLHSFHQKQLEMYPIAACYGSLGGVVQVDTQNKEVKYIIFSSNTHKKNEFGTIVERHKFSPMRMLMRIKHNISNQEREAKANLTAWTRELLWSDTKVVVDVV